MTKYYKLLKDLPTFKKGELFYLSKAGNLVAVDPKSEVIAYTHSTLEHFPNILKDWFKEVDDPNGRREPKEGDVYCYIQARANGIGITSWTDDDFDRGANEIGNVFRTEDEAKKAVEWLKARKVLFDDAKGFKPNWKDEKERKWSVYLDWGWTEEDGCRFEGLDADYDVFEVYGPGPYFATKEDAEASIKAHKKEWKVYLGVEE